MKTIWFLVGGFLLTACITSNCSAESATDSYAQRVFELINKQRNAISRLSVSADLTAQAFLAGGSFYLAGDNGWVSEGFSRAGGLLSASPLPTLELFKRLGDGEQPLGVVPQKGDVVWLSYSSESYEVEVTEAKNLEEKGCLVVSFGPQPQRMPPAFSHWIDSFTGWEDDPNFTRMGNILSLWTLTGEVAANTARHDRTLAFYQSIVVYGALERNELYINTPPYKGTMFHAGIPQMKSVQAGVLAQTYLDYVATMLREIRTQELRTIVKVGQEIGRRASESRPAALMVSGHLMPYAVSRDSKLFHYLDFWNDRKNLENLLGQDGYFVWIGYVAVPLDLWHSARRAGASAVWIVSPLPAEVDFRQFGDIVINQGWRIGDSAVEVPGYDVRILPPSGVAQLFIYELLVRAAGFVV